MQNDLHKNNSKIVTIEEDPNTGDLLLPIPQEMLDKLQWSENTELTVEISESGEITITEKR